MIGSLQQDRSRSEARPRLRPRWTIRGHRLHHLRDSRECRGIDPPVRPRQRQRYSANYHIRDCTPSLPKFYTGQPIRLSIVTSAPRRNPFDNAHMPGRPLSERISRPRSLSPGRDVDRYVPSGGGRHSRSPLPRRRGPGGGGGGGRRPGARREGGGGPGGGNNGSDNKDSRGRSTRPKKTQEELDAEMANYFNSGANADESAPAEPAAATGGATQPAGDDVDMGIE